MKVALYARVSTDDKEQAPETQLYALRQFCRDANYEVYQEYVDQARAKDYARRKSWQQLLKDARQYKFKLVLVFRLDRAFRSVRECVNNLEDWHERGIGFKSIKEDMIDTSTSQGKFMLQIIAAMAELESSIIGDRVRAGMARAKSQGNTFGRKPLAIPLQTIYNTLQEALNTTRAAKQLGCHRTYINKRLREYGVLPKDVIEGRWKPPEGTDETAVAETKIEPKIGEGFVTQ
jgi:DNA invertase Pin-like site-specific DNA recombinase